MVLGRLAAAVASLLLAFTPAATDPAPAPLKILTIGDSRSTLGQWQAELGRLLAESGVAATISTAAVAGTDCYYWTSRISGLLATYSPDVVVLACGTNDDPAATIYGESKTGWSFRFITETVHASGAQMIPALVQYSDPILAPPFLLTNEPQTNDHLYSQYHHYTAPEANPPWWAAAADFQVIPATASYLAAEPYTGTPSGWIGIHPNARGYRYMGRIVYDAGAADGIWPATTEAPLCDLYGHRNGYPRPAYVPCS